MKMKKLISKYQNGEKIYYNQLNTSIPKIINPKYNDFVRQADQLTYQLNPKGQPEISLSIYEFLAVP